MKREGDGGSSRKASVFDVLLETGDMMLMLIDMDTILNDAMHSQK
jgi:hypothetical protein